MTKILLLLLLVSVKILTMYDLKLHCHYYNLNIGRIKLNIIYISRLNSNHTENVFLFVLIRTKYNILIFRVVNIWNSEFVFGMATPYSFRSKQTY